MESFRTGKRYAVIQQKQEKTSTYQASARCFENIHRRHERTSLLTRAFLGLNNALKANHHRGQVERLRVRAAADLQEG